MSINLDWPYATASPPPASHHQMMYRSDIGLLKPCKANADDANYGDNDELWKRTCLKHSDTEEHQMLSFTGSEKAQPLPYFIPNTSAVSPYNPNFTGYYRCTGAANMHDLFNGPFTPSQWLELEHQALIYKHITSNMPVPPSLLMPIRRALSHDAFHYNAGHFTPMGWSGFHLGMQNNNDPEPGRCRRTDGKKWRCSRDSVTDQKYCERHINRGRHRSRKPVEAQSRYSIGNHSSAHLNLMPTSSAVVAGNNNFISKKHDFSLEKKKLHLGTSESAPNSRTSMNKEITCDGTVRVDYLVPHSSIALNPRESLYNIHNNKERAYGQSFENDFGLVSSDALKNPHIRLHSTPPHQLFNDCSKNEPDHSSTMWPNLNDTQLSISTAIAYHVKDHPSSSTLAWEFDSMPTGLELGGSKHCDQQPESEDKSTTSWIPVLHDLIIGGPLGEVLQNGSNANNTKTAELNLMTNGCDKGTRFTSSPTGVLQKEAAFSYCENSSAGTSPGAETNTAAAATS